MSTRPQQARISAPDRRLAAMGSRLGWAQKSAELGDDADALGWVQVVEAPGDQITQAWLSALAKNQAS